MTSETETWVAAWRFRGRDKSQLFDSKADAAQLVRELLASDTDLLILSRVPVRVTFQVTTIEPTDDAT